MWLVPDVSCLPVCRFDFEFGVLIMIVYDVDSVDVIFHGT